MPILACMWLKDDGGASIRGGSEIMEREGSIEIISFSHGLLAYGSIDVTTIGTSCP